LDHQIRFASKNNYIMYVIPLLYRLSSATPTNEISITRLRQALNAVVTKHNILRTALYLDTNSTLIQQCFGASVINDHTKIYGFSVINLHNNDRNMDKIINEILNQSDLFDLPKGRVIHCHILRQHRSNHSSTYDRDLLSNDDLILFSIYHAVFDGTSTSIFIRDFCQAYENNGSLDLDDNTLQYIDYSVHEHIMNTALSREFWYSQLEEYNLQHPLALPRDRQLVLPDEHSGLSYAAQITFDDEISMSFLNYASSHNLTLFQLGLAVFYVFLFKLTHGQTDLCFASVNANRYRNELQDMIGMFVATLPYRVELDPHWSFNEVVKHVREKSLSILKHSHYSLQQILADCRLNQSNVAFLETMFDFIIVSSDVDHFTLNDACFEQVSTDQSYQMAKFDFSLSFVYNPSADDNRLSCRFVCSSDLFEEITVAQIGLRFQHMFEQVFGTKLNVTQMGGCIISINKLSVILLEEAAELHEIIFHRLENIINEGMQISISFEKRMLT
jgi:hypothetical protein